MGINREGEPQRRIARGQGGEPKGTPATGRVERPQPRMVTVDNMMLKDELALHQGAADGLTQAGLGTFSFVIAEQQIVPATGKPVGEDAPFVVVTYSGLENRDRLWNLVGRAKNAKQKAGREGKPQEEVDQAVQDEIRAGIESEVQREAHFRAMLDSLHRKPGQ